MPDDKIDPRLAHDLVPPPAGQVNPTPAQLHAWVVKLCAWLGYHQAWFAAFTGVRAGDEQPLPPPPSLADVEAMGVSSQFMTVVSLRRIREAWDTMVRDHEGREASRACGLTRAALYTAVTLQVAGVRQPAAASEEAMCKALAAHAMCRVNNVWGLLDAMLRGKDQCREDLKGQGSPASREERPYEA